MAYNSNLYNPYGMQIQPQLYQQQPINGLMFIDDISVLDTLQMPKGSVSQPYFLKDENKFVIVTFDNAGGMTKELFSFKKEQISNPNDKVTKADLDAFKAEIMEAINGKHAIQPSAAESATEQPIASTPADQSQGTI